MALFAVAALPILTVYVATDLNLVMFVKANRSRVGGEAAAWTRSYSHTRARPGDEARREIGLRKPMTKLSDLQSYREYEGGAGGAFIHRRNRKLSSLICPEFSRAPKGIAAGCCFKMLCATDSRSFQKIILYMISFAKL